jgi:hypothetical protein
MEDDDGTTTDQIKEDFGENPLPRILEFVEMTALVLCVFFGRY